MGAFFQAKKKQSMCLNDVPGPSWLLGSLRKTVGLGWWGTARLPQVLTDKGLLA